MCGCGGWGGDGVEGQVSEWVGMSERVQRCSEGPGRRGEAQIGVAG